ncbi:MAG: protein translocase subunit SecD [Desulfotomaculaceae bacterium]|nr:protein translocase subunit SecD [Desulfotomaculaceae bacterium]
MVWSKLVRLVVIVLVVATMAVLAVTPVFPEVEWLPVTKLIKQGLDLQGGVHVALEAQDTPEAQVTDERVKQAMAIIKTRIDAYGVAEPLVQQQGQNRIIVELAGVHDPDKAVRDMLKTAYLEFKTEDGTTVLTGSQLKNATEVKDPQSGKVHVDLEFEPDGAKIFAEVTAANVGKQLAILLDGKVLQTPTVNEPIPNGRAQITGYESLPEAHNIAILLKSGALPVKVEVMEKRTVGPTLGADSLAKSINAGSIGLIAILIFMVLYYRLPGLVADFALVVYALLMLIIFAALNITMTLPGVAGFLLSLGMAVDANVIIFERFREEAWSGKSLQSSIDSGFKRAFVAIFDANMTTLVAAIVLFYFGTGPIKGFAVTLGIGIVVSMFTAITVTRYMLRLLAGSNLVRNLRIYGA